MSGIALIRISESQFRILRHNPRLVQYTRVTRLCSSSSLFQGGKETNKKTLTELRFIWLKSKEG